ncbi:dienelactone hydrolase family protein [Candidatus Microgenomates bacterium]|nr:MAG: dienelactone hydrolase family protein [Candidatus Microgenomates bacterium]
MKKEVVAAIIVLVIIVGGIFLFRDKVSTQSLAPSESPQSTNAVLLVDEGEYEITSQDVNYFEDTNGFYARPTQDGIYPGVVMIHEWWGLNDQIKEMAGQLAAQGYNVLAVDLYNGQVVQDAAQARELTSSLDQEQAIENMLAAIDYLESHGAIQIGSLGWCFGGKQSMQLALSGEPLDATVIYYGQLVSDEDTLEQIEWPLLGIFGEEDQSIPVATVNEFENVLYDVGVENEIYVYPGVGHAFANPTGASFAPNETRDAWDKTLAFLNKHLKN